MNPEVINSIKRLRDIENLPFDWNGYGAECFSSMLIDKCERIIKKLYIQPLIYPRGIDSIQFQYELNDRSYLEFEIFEIGLCIYKFLKEYTQLQQNWN